MDVALRPFEDDDLPRLRRWLAVDHVRPWFEQPEDWMAEVEGRHGEYAWISHFVIEADGEPVGFCQLYPFSASGEDWNGALPVEGTYSLDYLLGEPTLLRRGIARAALSQLIGLIAAEPDAERIIVQPDRENVASRGLLRALGFSYDEADDLFAMDV